MKWDNFYEGLNPEYWCILAHKVDGEHPVSYSDLLLVVQKLERWAEARDLLLPNTTMTEGSNATQPQALGNLFPSRKLKGNWTFMAWSAIVESAGTEEDLTTGLEGEEEVESSEGDPVKLVEQISHSAISSDLPTYLNYTKRKTRIVSGAAVMIIWWRNCPKDLSKVARKVSLNMKEGTMKRGSWTPQKPVVTQLASLKDAPRA